MRSAFLWAALLTSIHAVAEDDPAAAATLARRLWSAGSVSSMCEKVWSNKANPAETFHCVGFMAGFSDTVNEIRYQFTQTGTIEFFCPPEDGRYADSVHLALRDHLFKHPEDDAMAASSILLKALQERYPCPITKPVRPATAKPLGGRPAAKRPHVTLECAVIRADAEKQTLGALLETCQKFGKNREECLRCL